MHDSRGGRPAGRCRWDREGGEGVRFLVKILGVLSAIPFLYGIAGLRTYLKCRCVATGPESVDCPCTSFFLNGDEIGRIQMLIGFGATSLVLLFAFLVWART